jgi:hypothetical protein
LLATNCFFPILYLPSFHFNFPFCSLSPSCDITSVAATDTNEEVTDEMGGSSATLLIPISDSLIKLPLEGLTIGLTSWVDENKLGIESKDDATVTYRADFGLRLTGERIFYTRTALHALYWENINFDRCNAFNKKVFKRPQFS